MNKQNSKEVMGDVVEYIENRVKEMTPDQYLLFLEEMIGYLENCEACAKEESKSKK